MNDGAPVSLERLRELLDAYGADPERWPVHERDAALALLSQSPVAQRWRQDAARLDGVLDLASVDAISPDLVDRILAATRDGTRRAMPSGTSSRPVSRVTKRPRVWRYAGAALPLAAAAALVFWLQAEPARLPQPDAVAVAEIGVYVAPTDDLLADPELDALEGLPSFGCADSGLGCLDAEPSNDQSALNQERYA